MSRCLNKAMLIGYLGADPEIRTVSGGGRVAQLTLATTRRWTDGNGAPKKKTEWHRIAVWDSLPATFAFVEAHARKGARVYVEGEIQYSSYLDRDGVERRVVEIRAGEVLAAGEPNGRVQKDTGVTPPSISRGTTRRVVAVQTSVL